MRAKDAVITLKEAGIRNSEIAKLLNVSKQYVSYVCRTSQVETKQAKLPTHDGLVTISVASRLLDTNKDTIRRWSDQGKILTFRSGKGRRDRRFRLSELWRLRTNSEADNETRTT